MAFNGIDDTLRDYGDIMSIELIGAITSNLNYLIDSVPPGIIIPIFVGLPNVPTPDSALWQLCDGSVISDLNSPLRGHVTPDMASLGLGMKGFTTASGTTGGSRLKNLSHSHGGGLTGPPTYVDSMGDRDDSNDEARPFDGGHKHSIASDLTSPINFDPIHIKIVHYIKIK